MLAQVKYLCSSPIHYVYRNSRVPRALTLFLLLVLRIIKDLLENIMRGKLNKKVNRIHIKYVHWREHKICTFLWFFILFLYFWLCASVIAMMVEFEQYLNKFNISSMVGWKQKQNNIKVHTYMLIASMLYPIWWWIYTVRTRRRNT